MSLIYIGIVVLLHIYSKMGAPEKVEPAPATDGSQGQQQSTTS